MNTDSVSRYNSLIKHIKNWPVYFLNKWKGQPPITRFLLRKHGIRISVPRETLRVFKEFFMSDAYLVELLKTYLPKNAVVVDIGANIGMFPIRLLLEQPDIRFYSYEPLPNNYSILHENVSGTPFTQNRISIFNKAVVGKKQDNLKIYFNKNQNFTDSSSLISGFENNYDSLPIACTTLEELYAEEKLPYISLLKLDCEGSEFSILYDTPVGLINKIPFIVVETHDLDEEKNNISGVKTFLSNLGYTFKTKPVTDKINMVWAWK